MLENLSGIGDVYVRETRESIGRFPFSLRAYQRPGRVIVSIDLEVKLDGASATRFVTANTPLVLRVPGGRCVDFYVSSVSGFGDRVGVTPAGGLRNGDDPA